MHTINLLFSLIRTKSKVMNQVNQKFLTYLPNLHSKLLVDHKKSKSWINSLNNWRIVSQTRLELLMHNTKKISIACKELKKQLISLNGLMRCWSTILIEHRQVGAVVNEEMILKIEAEWTTNWAIHDWLKNNIFSRR